MTPDEEVLSEKILDDLFYPNENDCFDEIVKDAEEALSNEALTHDQLLTYTNRS